MSSDYTPCTKRAADGIDDSGEGFVDCGMRALPSCLPLLVFAVGCARAPSPAPAPPPSPAPRAVAPLPRQRDLSPDVELRLRAAFQRSDAGDPAGALAAVRALSAASEGSCDLSERLAHLSRRLGAIDLAWRFARQAVRLQPESAAALWQLGLVERDLDETAAVGARFRKARDLAPDSVEPRLALADFLESEQHLALAEEERRALIALQPDNPAGWGLLATNLHRQDRWDDARAALETADRLAPGNPAVWTLRAQIDLDEASWIPERAAELRARARQALEEGMRTAPVPAGAFLLGRACEESGDARGARAAWERAYRDAPDQPGLRPRLARLRIRQGAREAGEALLTEERVHTQTREEFSRLLSRAAAAPEDPVRRRELARACDARGMAARARLEWGRLLETRPGDPEARARLAALAGR